MPGARVKHTYRQLFQRKKIEAELDDEIRAYSELLVERHMAKGLTREQAKRAVRLAFEGPEQVKEKVRKARMTSVLETILQDLRYAGRLLYKSPGFTFFAVLTIALGLGANAAIFSLVNGVLLKSTGYRDPERIVQLWEKRPDGGRNGLSGANYLDWARQLTIPPNAARDYHYLLADARLKPGVSVAQAQAEMSAIAGRIAEMYPAIKKGWGAVVDRYLDRVVDPDLRLALTVLMWAVLAVLAICCANLSNLLMARATLRSREIALRMALGANRRRVIRMLLTESLVVSACGAVVGIALGYGLLKWIHDLLPPFYLPSEADIAMDGRVLLFLAVVTVLTSIAFGLAPAIEASWRNAAESLKEGGRAVSASRRKIYLRHLFVAGQVAVALVLLVGAGLLIRSFQRLMNVDVGFNAEGVIAYASFAQNPVVGLGIVVRGGGNPEALIKSVERAVWRINKNQVLDDPRTVEQIKAESLMTRRLPTMLLSGFALLAMVLACAGIYGVLSFVTAGRAQELGIRAALGASRTDLVRMVMGDGAKPVLAGIVVGIGGAIGLTRLMQSMLFATKPIDVPTFFGVSALFLCVGLVACLVPAWRASKIDPMSALRQE